MKETKPGSIAYPLLFVTVGGIVTLGLCYALYYGVFMLAESTLYRDNPMSVNAGAIRNSYAIILMVIYLVSLRWKYNETLKATIGVGPMALVLIALTLALYQQPAIAAISIIVVAACYVLVAYRNKKSWVYYYAIGLSVAAAVFYAWPRE